MKLKLLIYNILLLITINGFGQLDTIFWFAAPATSASCANTSEANLILTNTNNFEAWVTISTPAGGAFADINETIPPKSTIRVNLWEDLCQAQDISNRSAIENRPSGGVVNALPNGIMIHVTNRIPIKAHYEIRGSTGSELLSLKGKNALGSQFFGLFQSLTSNSSTPAPEEAFSSINIVATQDNTRLTINPNGKSILGLSDGTANFTITLNRGESIPLIPGPNASGNPNNAYQAPTDRLNGVEINATIGAGGPAARVAVTLCDDAVYGRENETGPYNIVAEQLFPIEKVYSDGSTFPLAGSEYLLPKGEAAGDETNNGSTPDDTYDQYYVVATQDNTTITFTEYSGNTPVSPQSQTLNAGETFRFTYQNDFSAYAHVTSGTDEPFYVLHTTATNETSEISGSYIQPMSECIGSTIAEFSRGNAESQTNDLSLMIWFKELSSGDPENVSSKFKLEWTPFAGDPLIYDLTAGGATYSPVNLDWQIKIFHNLPMENNIRDYAHNRIYNTNKNVLFHAVILDGNSTTSQYSSISNIGPMEIFSSVIKTNAQRADICLGDTAQLFARGNMYNSYEWLPQEYLNNYRISEPYTLPRQNITYYPEAKHTACNLSESDSLIITVGDSISAYFEMDKSWACAPDSVVITNNSLPAPEYSWYIDDTLYSNQELASHKLHLFNNTDTIVKKKIKLTAQSDLCIRSMTQYVEMLPEIHTGFTVDIEEGCHPLQVNFTDTTAGNTDPDQYTWNFGDDESSELVNPTHTYYNYSSDDTIFTVKLLTTSPYACSDSAFHDIHVFPYISGEFSADSTQSCSPLIVDFDPNASVAVDTFIWNIYDTKLRFDTLIINDSPDIVNYAHTDYTQNEPDTIIAELTVKNRFNCSHQAISTQLVSFPVVQSDFTIDNNQVCDSTEVTFTNTSIDGPLITYEWDFGDANTFVTDTIEEVSNTYFNRENSTVQYDIQLISYNTFSCADTLTHSIDVYPFVNADFNYDIPDNCAPVMAQINNSSLGADINAWDFGDGSSEINNSAAFTHNFINPNTDKDTTFYIKLLTTNNEGCSDSVTYPLLLHPTMATNFDIVTADAGCNPLTVGLLNTSEGLPDADYTWEFDNGNVSGYDGRDTFYITYNHYEANNILYDISLTGSDLYGCDSTISKPVDVYSFVEANININNIDSCAPFSPIIKNASSAGATNIVWNYGDYYNISTKQYLNQGSQVRVDTLALTASNVQGCIDYDTTLITIYPELDVSVNPTINEGCEPLEVTFFNNSDIKTGTKYTWDFDDASTLNDSVAATIEHTFQNNSLNDKIFNVRLHGITQYGCQDSTDMDIKVYRKVTAGFYTDKNAVCFQDPVLFKSTSTGATIFEWYDENDIYMSGSPNSFSYQFNEDDITKEISLIASYNGACHDTVTHKLNLLPIIDAEIIFNNDDSTGCHPFNGRFKGVITPDDQDYRYVWNFGKSGVTETGIASETRLFYNEGKESMTYPLSFSVENRVSGCTGYDSTNVTVFPNPKAEFIVNTPLNVCAPYEISVSNTSSPVLDENNFYNWYFDDGTIVNNSTENTITHTYTNEGPEIFYPNLKLLATTENGCKDSIIETFTIYPTVEATFEINPDTFSCSPLSVQIVSTASKNATNYLWDLGDGTLLDTKNPDYTYFNRSDTTQIRTVRLYASSDYLCRDTVDKEVVIYAQPEAFFYATPISQFYPESTVDISNLTQFNESWNYEWDFDDGTTSTEVEPVHIYNYWGDFDITARVYTDFCESAMTKNVKVLPSIPEAGFESIIEGCEPLEVTFRDTSKYGHTHIWNFDDKGQPVYSGPGDDSLRQIIPFGEVFTHIFDSAGEYNISLRVEGDGGVDIFYKVITVFPLPEIDFRVSPALIMLPNERVKGFNRTKGAIEYLWNFGDGSTYSDFEPIHLYEEEGEYIVSLTATSEQGCVITKESSSAVSVEDIGKIEFPDAFMPSPTGPTGGSYNGDQEYGDVTVFYPVTEGVVEYNLEIYDKWGELIFTSDKLEKGWDGYIDGKMAPQSVYMWYVTGTFINGESFQFVGNVTLLYGKP